MKRVLLTTYPSAYLHHGGGEREILLLREALNESDIMADIYGPTSQTVTTYDFAIHSSMAGGGEHIVRALAEAGIRLILWPNLWFVVPPSKDHLAHLDKFLSRFEAIVFRSFAEEVHFRQFFNIDNKVVINVSCLVAPCFQRRDISDVFRESYGLTKYAIWPGIIEPQKNQLSAIRAFNGLDIDLIVSGRIRDNDYAARCREEAGKNIRIIPAMSFGSELHLSALLHSSLFIELPFDFPGASALEAATMGCPMLLSRGAWTDEILGKKCVQVDPQDISAIRSSVQDVLNAPRCLDEYFPYVTMSRSIAGLVAYLNS